MNEIRIVFEKVVTALSGISGIEAVVLGYLRARGTHPLNPILTWVSIMKMRHSTLYH